MAKLNGNIFNEIYGNSEKGQKDLTVFLQDCLTEEEFNRMHEDYRNTDRSIPLWKFANDNIKVTYKND